MTATAAAPGPAGMRIFGSFFDMRKEPLEFFVRCARQYGDVCFFRAFESFVLVSNPRLIHQVFNREGAGLKRSRRGRELRMALGEGLVLAEGDRWRLLRDALSGEFHSQKLLTNKRQIKDIIEARMKSWEADQTIDLRAQMARLTLNIAAVTFFDTDFTDDEDNIANALEVVNHEFASVIRAWIPIPLDLPSLGYFRVRKSYRILAEVAKRIMERADTSPSDATNWIVKLRKMCETKGLPFRLALDQVIFLIMASYDTTAVALTYTLWVLAQNPSYQNKLAETIIAHGDRRGADMFVKPAFQEAMRLFPPVWGLGREVTSEFHVADYRVAPGTQLLALPFLVHRDPRYFDDPDEFRPERFEHRTFDSDAYFPFGVGPQACMGANFSTIESLIILTLLLSKYEFIDASPSDLGSSLGITMRPRNDIVVCVRRRSNAP